jgi:D-alanyl-D-alanine carboxypeptidase
MRTLLAAVLLVGCGATADAPRAAPQVPAAPIRDAAALLAWIDSHREHVGLAAYEVGEPQAGIYLAADERFSLASTRKVLILAAYARAVVAGAMSRSERVAIDDVDRWYLHGTDGGAHLQAIQDWTARGRIEAGAVTLDDIAWAMIRWSDNAAADYLLARVGADAVAALAREMGMAQQEPGGPILGEYLAWARLPADEWLALDADQRAERATRLADASRPEAQAAVPMPALEVQRRLATRNPRGTPREWAALMARLETDSSDAVTEVLRDTLEWPLIVFPDNQSELRRLGTKGGSLPGLVTEASYYVPSAPPERTFVAALFFRELPPDVERDLLESFAHQHFMRRLALDPAFRASVRARLARP